MRPIEHPVKIQKCENLLVLIQWWPPDLVIRFPVPLHYPSNDTFHFRNMESNLYSIGWAFAPVPLHAFPESALFLCFSRNKHLRYSLGNCLYSLTLLFTDTSQSKKKRRYFFLISALFPSRRLLIYEFRSCGDRWIFLCSFDYAYVKFTLWTLLHSSHLVFIPPYHLEPLVFEVISPPPSRHHQSSKWVSVWLFIAYQPSTFSPVSNIKPWPIHLLI